jgi:hypothetical protein
MVEVADAIGFLNFSAAAKADSDLTGFYNDRHLPAPV